jgi:hypothetical protein
MPALEVGERHIAEARGVMLGWQPRTILIWWLPGLVFIGLAQVQFRSWLVTAGLAVFCAALFLFYASDREVRPLSGGRKYVLTSRRLLMRGPEPLAEWRPMLLTEISQTHMEDGLADRAVRVLAGAATIVLELRAPGPKGEPRKMRIGPVRRATAFRAAIDQQLTVFERRL